jgi:hypothetical protein
MDNDIEDALELANKKHQLCLQKQKEKFQQIRSFQYVEEPICLESNLHSSSSFEINIQRIPSPLSDVGCLEDDDDDVGYLEDDDDDHDEIYLDIDEGIKSIDDCDQIDLNTFNSNLCMNPDQTIDENVTINANRVLHPYTNLSTETFCYRLLK